jgi:hypothetical protein
MQSVGAAGNSIEDDEFTLVVYSQTLAKEITVTFLAVKYINRSSLHQHLCNRHCIISQFLGNYL